MNALTRKETKQAAANAKKKNMFNEIASATASVDNLRHHRELLQKKDALTLWDAKSGPRRIVFYAAKNMRRIEWKKAKSKKASDVRALELSAVSGISAGPRPGGHKKGNKASKTENSFSISAKIDGKKVDVDLEAPSPEKANQWVAALRAWLKEFRENPDKLVVA